MAPFTFSPSLLISKLKVECYQYVCVSRSEIKQLHLFCALSGKNKYVSMSELQNKICASCRIWAISHISLMFLYLRLKLALHNIKTNDRFMLIMYNSILFFYCRKGKKQINTP